MRLAPPPSIGIIVGLKAEARLARRWGLPVVVGGGTAHGAAEAAERLARTATALLSFGLAGGLDPVLPPGALIVPATVTDADERWTTDPALNATLGGTTGHTLLGGGALLATIAEKRAAHARGADAVDLESAAVARVATRHSLPFAVLRAICDPATRSLPHAALAALDAHGRIGILRVLFAALAHPTELTTLIALARDAAQARHALLTRVRSTLQ